MSSNAPDRDAQRQFWDEWNHDYREHGLDEFMQAQRDMALAHAPKRAGAPLRILEVGCGNGWLSNELSACGEVTGIDLSPRSIARARELYPKVHFESGDFKDLSDPGPYDYVVSADVIGHLTEQKEFVRRIATLLRPGGSFLLMTQNPYVWNRSSYLAPQGEGQIRDWPDLEALRDMMGAYFTITRVHSIVPGGDQGTLKLANSRFVLRLLRSALGWRRSTALYERARIGRELVLVAVRHSETKAKAAAAGERT